MRILHTADWHLGKTLEGRSRLPEQAQFLDELQEIVEQEKIDVVLMAGDVFDTVNPPAQAEQLFYDSMSRLSDKGKRPVVVISGNHDNPDRLSASSPLATEQNIHLIGYPTSNIVTIPVPSLNEGLNVAALAYPSEARLEQLLSEEHDEILLRDQYDEKIRDLFQLMAEQFKKDTVNIAMSHLYVQGGASTDSERPIEVGGAYTVRATSLPQNAQYVALGHLHRPQNVKKALTKARYSGSPLAYSFSEAGYAKSVSIIDVKPREEASVSEVYITSGKPLVKWKAKAGLKEVYQWLEEGKDRDAWIDLEIQLTNNLSLEEIHRLRKAHDGFIHIRPIFQTDKEMKRESRKENVPIDEVFRRFYAQQTGGAEPEGELVQLFLELIAEDEKVGVDSN
ncbi:exonuclease SbcCD subunit D [Bacillus sp. FJAT-47783]|uniref:exonuclease SbcCD subunit D n=1 Tax=Bacillus sp. FJAT-47783 TaxID=2922712 RepID=UPI001FAB41D9|nr:exonuclease SbcCD subunit D [Bacillus sp. FJAT-47783]